MSTNVTFNGVQYSVPAYQDVGYAQGAGNLSSYLIAIASGSLQQTGGNFTLTAPINFGPSFGLLALYYASRTANPASTGILRLANNSDAVSWRNATNTADLALTVNAANHLAFNGIELESNTLTSSHIFVGNASNESTDVAMTGDVSIANTGATAIADAVVTGKLITGYVSGAGTVLATDSILQAIQKINGNDVLKLPLAGGTLTGDLTLDNNKALILRETTANGTDAVTLKAPASVTTSYTVNLPPAQGGSGQVMQNDGSGNMSWVANGSGTVGSGTQYQIPYYAATGTSLSAATNINYNASGDLEILNGKNLQLDGATSGNAKLKAAATTTSYALTMPSAQGSGSLSNDGSGNLSWSATNNYSQYASYTIGTASAPYTGSLTVFDLPFTYITDGKNLQVFYNGQQLIPGVDYTETSTTKITLTFSSVSGGKMAFRTVAVGAVAGPVTLQREDYVVGTALNNYTGSTTVFNLVNTYNVAGNSMMVTLDGDVQTKGASIDYLETNNQTVTFNNALVAGQKVSFIWANTASAVGVNSGTANQAAYYAASGGTVSGTDAFTVGSNGPNGIIKGTTTNDSASAGFVGQYVENVVSGVNLPASTVTGDATSISLTAGDWDVTALANITGVAGTMTSLLIAISTTSGNSLAGTAGGNNRSDFNNVSAAALGRRAFAVPCYRMSLASTTTVYLKMNGNFSSTSPTLDGRISARRVR